MMSVTRVISLEELSGHRTEDSCWIVVDGGVYDVTKFMKDHPGGKKILLSVAGQDASQKFHLLHQLSVLSQYEDLLIGKIENGENDVNYRRSSTALAFGSSIPFAEPYWYRKGFKTPYYTEGHKIFRNHVRQFVDREIVPFVHQWDEVGEYPPELVEKAYNAGIYGATWPTEYGGTPPDNFDAFHDFILLDELARCSAGGLISCFFSFGIALPPVLNVGSEYLKNLVARDVITGKKIMCLAVTEPNAGSDVAQLQTTAVRDGEYYIVNGTKKFITSGVKADYFTTAVRTGPPGMGGISLLLLEKGMPGISVRRMKTQGWWISNTAFIVFEDVRVPVRNLIGKENRGFGAIMRNFNHERFTMAAMSNRYARICLEESIRYGRIRKTFGKRLIDHQVIRHKIAEMAREIESTHALLEQIAFQMKSAVDDMVFAGILSLAKVQATKTMEFCAREASQIFGGNSYIRGGEAISIFLKSKHKLGTEFVLQSKVLYREMVTRSRGHQE